MASLFLVGLGAKLWLIYRCSSAFPYLDQWPAEAIDLYIPYLNHEYTPALLFKAHNEHRIVLSRLVELLLLICNGQWDAQLEMVVNAIVYCAGIAGFGWLLASIVGQKYWPLLWLTLTAHLALPIAWENTLWGFQLPFYFLLLFSMLTIWGLGLGKPLSSLWFIGVFSAVAAAFDMASGFLAAAAVLAVGSLEFLRRRQDPVRELINLGFCGAMVVVGLLLTSHVSEHDQFRPHSIAEFVTALAKNLAWPWPLHPWYALFNLLPLALLALKYLRSPEEAGLAGRFTLAIGLWVLLQSAAAAYARGAGGATPPWRYMDLLGFLMIANVLSIIILLAPTPNGSGVSIFDRVVFFGWAIGCAGGLYFLSEKSWTVYIPQLQAEQRAQLRVSREFLTSNNPRVFEGITPSQLPVENVEADIWLLRHPLVRAILPICAREGLPIVPAKTSKVFVRNGCQMSELEQSSEVCWGSYANGMTNGRGSFESLPINPGVRPYLEIPVAGNVNAPGNSLQIVGVASDKAIEIKPQRVAGDHWELVRVKTPKEQFRVVAACENSSEWFAFKEPREMGRFSYYTAKILPCWSWIMAAGMAVLGITLFQYRLSFAKQD